MKCQRPDRNGLPCSQKPGHAGDCQITALDYSVMSPEQLAKYGWIAGPILDSTRRRYR